jgi:putative transposase
MHTLQSHLHRNLPRTSLSEQIFNRLSKVDGPPAIFSKVCLDFEGPLVEMDGVNHHVHLLVNYPPKHSVSALVNSLKGVSSRLLRSERPDLVRRYWKGALWSPSYFAASCGGAPIDVLKAYIEQQKTPL